MEVIIIGLCAFISALVSSFIVEKFYNNRSLTIRMLITLIIFIIIYVILFVLGWFVFLKG